MLIFPYFTQSSRSSTKLAAIDQSTVEPSLTTTTTSHQPKRGKSIDDLQLTCRDLNTIHFQSPATHTNSVNEPNESELQNFASKDCILSTTSRQATPSSCYSESYSLDAARSQDCLTTRSVKKRVNIQTDFIQEFKMRSNGSAAAAAALSSSSPSATYEDLESGCETGSDIYATADRYRGGSTLSRYNTIASTTDSYITMTGTVKRGRKKGQSVDLQLNISRDELEKINAAALQQVASAAEQAQRSCCECNRSAGLHILLLSLVCLPFVTIVTGVYSFYIGTITWYNMFNYFYEEKSYVHKVLMSPLLVVAYPVLIVLCTVGLAIYAGLVQLSVQFTRWFNEIADIEKGFYGWLCGMLHLSDCSPYEVVILMDLGAVDRLEGDGTRRAIAQSSTDELSL